jgi:hypothetical protein
MAHWGLNLESGWVHSFGLGLYAYRNIKNVAGVIGVSVGSRDWARCWTCIMWELGLAGNGVEPVVGTVIWKVERVLGGTSTILGLV